jgi:hypothetical protein
MTALIQFIVLKRKGKWVVKSKDLERIFSVQQEAVDAAIRFANDSGKEGKPGVVLFQKSKSKFEKIWTYGQSPYPPPRSDLPMVSRMIPDTRRESGHSRSAVPCQVRTSARPGTALIDVIGASECSRRQPIILRGRRLTAQRWRSEEFGGERPSP